jgi:tetratricopeptide (TPR) repeat protein
MVEMPEDAAKEVAGGQRLLAEGDLKGALSRFNKALRIDPNNADAHFGKAEAAAALPNVKAEEIIASYQKAIELQTDPGEKAMSYSQLGAFCLREGKMELAEQSYVKAAGLDTENGPYYLSDLAIELYMSVVKRNDEEGSNLELDSARKKALAHFAKALDIDPKDAIRLLS